MTRKPWPWCADPADARLFWWALAVALTGMGCGVASVIAAYTWAATRSGGWLTAAHWLTRVAFALLVAVWTCVLVMWRRKRRRAALRVALRDSRSVAR